MIQNVHSVFVAPGGRSLIFCRSCNLKLLLPHSVARVTVFFGVFFTVFLGTRRFWCWSDPDFINQVLEIRREFVFQTKLLRLFSDVEDGCVRL